MIDYGINGQSIFSPEANGLIGGYQMVPSTATDIKRTQTRLVVSENWRAAEKWLLDPRLPKLFEYQFGGPFWVVIPKGRIVALATNGGPNNDGLMTGYISRQLFNVITFANGGVDVPNETDSSKGAASPALYTRTANRPFGVAASNIVEQRPDDMADVLPDILARGTYIELPLIDTQANAERFPWGSAYGVLHAGDYVMSDKYGRFIEWQEYPTLTQTFDSVIADGSGAATVYVDQPIKNYVPLGQTFPVTVTAVEHGTTTEVPTAEVFDVKCASGAVTVHGLGNGANVDITVAYITAIPQNYDQIVGQVMAINPNLPPEGWLQWVEWSMQQKMQSFEYISWGYRPEDISTGYPYSSRLLDRILGDPPALGIPGLTNGSNIEVQYTAVKVGTVPANVPAGTMFDIFLPNKPIVSSTLHIYVGDTNHEITGANLVFHDPVSGLVRFTTADTATTDRSILATYKATGQIPGVPTNIDFAGAVGAVRIMLL